MLGRTELECNKFDEDEGRGGVSTDARTMGSGAPTFQAPCLPFLP